MEGFDGACSWKLWLVRNRFYCSQVEGSGFYWLLFSALNLNCLRNGYCQNRCACIFVPVVLIFLILNDHFIQSSRMQICNNTQNIKVKYIEMDALYLIMNNNKLVLQLGKYIISYQILKEKMKLIVKCIWICLHIFADIWL